MKNKKSLGQNWLKNRVILDKIAELASEGASREESAGEVPENRGGVCLEIGPGLGFLTSSLLRRFDKVIAVEYDAELARKLPGSFPGKNLEVVNADILQFDFGKIKEPYVVAGNIPYYITSPIIEKVLTVENLPERVVLLMQKEVAERIVSEKETGLSLFVKNRAEVVMGPVVLRSEFTPPPKVDSQVIVMKPHVPIVSDDVMALARRGMRAPRKKLMHNLAELKSREELVAIFAEIGISPDARSGDLGLTDWQKLYNCIY